MVLYRITGCEFANDLSGTGARLFGGRWNSLGRDALYLASSRALAVLEVLVHLPPLMIPDNYCLVEVDVPDNSMQEVAIAGLPDNWKDVSPPVALKYIGDNFLRKHEKLVLKVPSSIVPMEYNYLLNVHHPAVKKVKILKQEPFDFDKRLVYNDH